MDYELKELPLNRATTYSSEEGDSSSDSEHDWNLVLVSNSNSASKSDNSQSTPIKTESKDTSEKVNAGFKENNSEPIQQSPNKPSSNVTYLRDMFPQFDILTISQTLEKCNNNIDRCIDELLSKDALKSELSRTPSSSMPAPPIASPTSSSTSILPTIAPIKYITTSHINVNEDSSSKIAALPSTAGLHVNAAKRRNDIIKKCKKQLPPSFLRPPSFRTVIIQETSRKIEYTVYFHRNNEGSLGVNVQHLGEMVMVNELLNDSKTNSIGLAQLAGIKVGDILTGVNFTYFDKTASLQDITTVVGCCGQYLSLQFIRYVARFASSSADKDDSNPDNPNGTTKKIYLNLPTKTKVIATTGDIPRYIRNEPIHPCLMILLDQGIIDSGDVEALMDVIIRLKKRTMEWTSGLISIRSTIGDIDDCIQNADNNFNSGDNDRDFDGRDRKPSLWGGVSSSSKEAISSIIINNSSNNGNDDASLVIKRICRSWKKDVSLSTFDLQPALCMRVTSAYSKQDHVEYIIWIEDVSSGLQWYTRRRYSEFYSLREDLCRIWSIFGKFEFPKRRLSVADQSGLIAERITQLNAFLRKIYITLFINPCIHPKTRQMYVMVQVFLDIPYRMHNIRLLQENVNISSDNLMLHDDAIAERYSNFYYTDSDEDDGIYFNNNDGNIKLTSIYEYLSNTVLQMAEIKKTQKYIEIYIQTILNIDTFQLAITSFLKRIKSVIQEYEHNNDDLNQDINVILKSHCNKCMKMLSEYIDNLQQIIIDGFHLDCTDIIQYYHNKNINQIYNKSNKIRSCNSNNTSTIDYAELYSRREIQDTIENVTNIAIRRQVEIEVYVPYRDNLLTLLYSAYETENAALYSKCCLLANMPQSFFGIPLEYISPSSWCHVINYMIAIKEKVTPYDRLQMLLTAAAEIPRQYSTERINADKSIGADDILPIFIYCLVMSKNKTLYSLSKELESLCDPHCRVSEMGYYVATLEASLQYIHEIDEVNGLSFSH